MTYKIVLKGHILDTMDTYFEPMHISRIDNGNTTLIGFVADQAVLFGVLSRIRDMNIELIELHQMGTDESNLSDST